MLSNHLLQRPAPGVAPGVRLYLLAAMVLGLTAAFVRPLAAEAPATALVEARLDTTPVQMLPVSSAPAFRDIPIISLDEATESGALRVLALHKPGQPQVPAVTPAEINMLKEYAREAERELAWVLVSQRWELLPALQRDRGDLIAGQNKDIQAGMHNQAEFTLPWTMRRQQVVGRRGSQPLTSVADLHDRQVAIRVNSPAYDKLVTHARKHAAMDIVRIPADQSAETILQRIEAGQYDLAVIDSGALTGLLPTYSELETLLDLPGGEQLVWAIHPDNNSLLESMDRYLSREALSRGVADVHFEDLPRIEERRTLRVITYKSPTNYYVDDAGELRGFEYELIRKFAQQRDLRVEMVVAPSPAAMQRWLLEGRGDIIAASVPAAGVRDNQSLSTSRPYNYAAPLIVGRDHDKSLVDARDLEGRRIVLPAGSSYREVLKRYQRRGIGVEIVEAEPEHSIADILHRVEVGIYDLTVVGSHKSRRLLKAEPGTKAHFPVSEPLPLSWVVRADNSQLLSAVNRFIDKTYRQRDYNVLHARYFEHSIKYTSPEDAVDNELLALGGELSPYDDLVRRHADEFGFDWRLIVAQMYQESRFNPRAVSDAGAVGLMQLLPTTADEIGITELYRPAASIEAGVRYLNSQYQRLDPELTFEDRIWFSLAAYNAGFGRLQQARSRAAAMGLDPDRWFDNVEKAMLSMADDTACHCGQPVAYVREIRARYHNYVRLTRATQYAARSDRDRHWDT